MARIGGNVKMVQLIQGRGPFVNGIVGEGSIQGYGDDYTRLVVSAVNFSPAWGGVLFWGVWFPGSGRVQGLPGSMFYFFRLGL